MAENDSDGWDTTDPEKAKWDYYLKDLDRCELEKHDEDEDVSLQIRAPDWVNHRVRTFP